MKAITKFLAGGVAIVALASAAPAAAQYYPGYGYGGIGQVIGQVFGGGYGGGYGYNGGYGVNSQAAISQCVGAVQQRLNGYAGYGYNAPYGGYSTPYAGGYGNARVLGISRVEPRVDGGLTVRGVANSGRNTGAYGYNNGQPRVDLTFRCKTDPRGLVYDVNVELAQPNYGAGYGSPYGYQQPYTPYNYDYSQYGYRRY